MEWIQCKDEMPPMTTEKNFERYLVNNNGWVYIAIMGDMGFLEHSTEMRLTNAIEWMPLPEPSQKYGISCITNDAWMTLAAKSGMLEG